MCPSVANPHPVCVQYQLILYIRQCILCHVLSNPPFFANYCPIPDKSLASLSIRIEPHYAVHLAAGYPSYGLKVRPPPFARPTVSASHLNTRGDHFLVLTHPTNDTAQPLCVLFSMNRFNGPGSATTRPPYQFRWVETARKECSAISTRPSLFSVERI